MFEYFTANIDKLPKIYLTHLCMHYSEPITLAELEEYCAQYDGRVAPAADGLSFAV